MNFQTIALLLVSGFGVSFAVLDVCRRVGRRLWPAIRMPEGDGFRPLSVFLALFAGPALFIEALWRMRAMGGMAARDWAFAVPIACGWACCYGIVVLQCIGMAGIIPAL